MKKNALSLAIALIVIAGSIYLAFRNVDIDAMLNALTTINMLWLAPASAVLLYTQWSRSIRWKILLNASNPHISTLNAFSSTMVGNFINCVITRLGELIRPYILARRESIPISTTLGSIVAERGFDVIAVIIFGIAVGAGAYSRLAATFPDVTVLFLRAIIPTIVIFAILGVLLLTPLADAILQFAGKLLPAHITAKLTSLWKSFLTSFTTVNKKQALWVAFRTAEIWFLFNLVTYFTLLAFPFYSTSELHFGSAVIITFVGVLAFTVAPTPAALGVYHFAVVAHALHYATHFIVGASFFIREQALGGLSLNNMKNVA
jgi:uncharacterized protein (TIRG00374 family)